ncbi:M14 family zinc carboxypeptidase [Sediminitomix flava]|uniref:Zinc carboxypeptidase n=1 Tax=Sediminitomix flava TaxID=379075 RepID=A0A315Z762_SEDFL|nr:M14 family zinc carboxypeptidase [Sediminitomix flava]PWJ40751.1 zinc carboxypeptidase [Sediminitomix flava]
MRYPTICLLIFLQLLVFSSKAQEVISPSEFLGYPLGSQFSFHHRVIDYFNEVANNSTRVQLEYYGKSIEGRPLVAAIISSEENLKNIDKIRANHLKTKKSKSDNSQNSDLPIVWLNYNIHGNEASCTETAMEVLYHLASLKAPIQDHWLDNMIVIIDPCANPDGRERYTNGFKQKLGQTANPNADSWEHQEEWPSARFNHYLFDLNRDWLWQTQIESQQRIALFQKWRPHVHVDFHEMYYESPYFFGPAAEPIHEQVTGWQREFHYIVSENNQRYFDKNNWAYFSEDLFDLLYPSYGDTWPLFNGSIGFTYEQGGHGKAGLVIKKNNGELLTLKQRITHHFTTSIATLEVVSQQKEKLLEEYTAYFEQKSEDVYKNYILKTNGQEDHVKALLKLLDKQEIEYHYASEQKKIKGFSYAFQEDFPYDLQKGDVVVPVKQTLGKLVTVLFEPQTVLTDSMTYDLTAWALPFVYGIEAYATKENIKTNSDTPFHKVKPSDIKDSEAYLLPWQSIEDASFLQELFKYQLKVRYVDQAFVTKNNRRVDNGTLIFLKEDNLQQADKFYSLLKYHAAKRGRQLIHITKKDMPKKKFPLVQKPNPLIIINDKIQATALGEVWHFMEQTLGVTPTIIQEKQLSILDSHKYSCIILVNGLYDTATIEKCLRLIRQDGKKVIALQKAMQQFAEVKETALAKSIRDVSSENSITKVQVFYQNRSSISENVAGSIFAAQIDSDQPVGYGYTRPLYLLKKSNDIYPLLNGADNVASFGNYPYMSGFAGHLFKDRIRNTLSIGSEKLGKGKLIYFVDSPIFRACWYGGMLSFANAIYFE